MNLRMANLSEKKYIQFEKWRYDMVVAPEPQQNTAKASYTYPQSFIQQVKIGLDAACNGFSEIFPKIVSLFHSLVTDGVNDAVQDTSTRTVSLYIRGIQVGISVI